MPRNMDVGDKSDKPPTSPSLGEHKHFTSSPELMGVVSMCMFGPAVPEGLESSVSNLVRTHTGSRALINVTVGGPGGLVIKKTRNVDRYSHIFDVSKRIVLIL